MAPSSGLQPFAVFVILGQVPQALHRPFLHRVSSRFLWTGPLHRCFNLRTRFSSAVKSPLYVLSPRGCRALASQTPRHSFSSYDPPHDKGFEILQPSSVAAVAATPAAVDLLEELFRGRCTANARDDTGTKLEIEAINAAFPHKLDRFQQDALKALVEGRSVVLSAPTGSGKTVVGEAAVYLALSKRMRVFYTTPLKALSNQKFGDFGRQFGEDRVGLLTGDTAINRDASVVVMTTEVYRNMLYEENERRAGALDGMFAVILDEFHYMNTEDRGTVWEESVINSPADVLLVALSATMANAEDVCEWFKRVHGPTALVTSTYRPVPLEFNFADCMKVWPLFANCKRDRNHRQKEKTLRCKEKKYQRKPSINPKLLAYAESDKTPRRTGKGGSGNYRYDGVPSYPFVLRRLRVKDMLPAIFFIFSREGCDRAANAASMERVKLLNPFESQALKERLDAFVNENPEIVNEKRVELARKGIAAHHAGLLPVWKVVVEKLFQDGLLKVIFATETLAAGINMPARTTVISSLSKRRGDEGIVKLTTSEVLQMAGRAGRRGKDAIGYSVMMKSPYEGAQDAFHVVTAEVDKLESKFTPTYGMVLSLLQSRSVEESQKLIQRSFGNFLRNRETRPKKPVDQDPSFADENVKDLNSAKEKILLSILEDARKIVSEADSLMLFSYSKLMARLRAEYRALHYLRVQREEQWRDNIDNVIVFSCPGTVVLLSHSKEGGLKDSETKRMTRRKFSKALEVAALSGDLSDLRSMYLEEGGAELESLEDDIGNESEQDPCEVVTLLNSGPNSTGEKLEFVGIAEDGTLRLFLAEHVVRVFDCPPLEIPSSWIDLNVPGVEDWDEISRGLHKIQIDGPWSAIVEQLQNFRKGSDIQALQLFDDSEAPEIIAQRARVTSILAKVRSSEFVKSPKYPSVVRAMKTVEKLEQHPRLKSVLQGESDASSYRRKRKLANSNSMEENKSGSGREDSMEIFMSIIGMLQEYGFINELHQLTDLGLLGAKVHSENELWTSLVLMERSLETAEPHHLAAVIGAVTVGDTRPDTYVGYQPSETVFKICGEMVSLRSTLEARQLVRGLDFDICLEPAEMGLVEKWAQGISWMDLLSKTSLQEGDVVRRFRRIMDLLRQIPHLPFVTLGLKINAKRALSLLDRFPVSDDITYSVRENEKYVDFLGDEETLDGDDDELDKTEGTVKNDGMRTEYDASA